ncbi:Uncharacterised protein [Mycolicibacterium vanbaalenii]|uniref:Uncharacterized protein n=1 Tax=Mycolicibacterium vanbaalenii TaxID=110539 RepID=A0A5S9PX48_MYCVN|nr:hypothetical protein [Mycolicibacterium vanbaalenii]CAA0108913.1 Uncharacterised protein [Mycolicibacterium vanbaalenii]
MASNSIGPILTLAAVAAVGGGIWVANVSQQTGPAAINAPVAQSAGATPAATATPEVPSPPPPAAFPARADYVGEIPTAAGVITLEVTIDGQSAKAYACDGNAVEVWLRGSATNGALALAGNDQTGRLTGHLDGASIAGTLTLGAKSWDFTAGSVASPAVDGADDVY